uniref:HECT-type E3 ubiquitin transferase n=1 Tax=Kalanchoe fedtschenkoi TaxID=63787 RepID=A0A7N0TV78_KALFE
MEGRGQKRPELGELPMDKRACSRNAPGSEYPIHIQAAANSVSSPLSEFHDGDMDADHTGTSYSEGEHEDNSAYGSCDSEGSAGEGSVPARNSLATYHRSQSSDQLAKLSKVISNLSKPDANESALSTTLTDLCEQLSFFNGYSLASVMVDSLSSILVKLAKHETSPNIMLLAIRAITYTCDVFPRAVGFFVKHEAVPALCQRLIAIEYLDVAEQCLQALDKIAHDQPLACLHSGVIMAALTYIDFFSTSIQRVALAIVVNICKKLPSDSHSSLMEALPILCNLLKYEDQQVSESVATCLIKITAQVSQSSALLDEMCNQGMINQVIHIIDVNSRTTRAALSQTVYIGLIGLLSKFACGSLTAFKTILEHNIGTILRDILCSCYLSTGFPVLNARAGQYNLMQEVLKLLNELLPSIDEGKAAAIVSDKKFYLVDHPKILQSLGTDILPPLIQVVNMGADMHICYGCLSFINKLVYFSKPEMLLELIQNLNISSFLAGVFTRKDPHVLILALQISETILQKQSDNFINSFIKDGVFFCIEALLKIQLSSQFMFPVIDGTNLSNEPCQMAFRQETGKCLCFALHAGHSSGSNPCKLKQDSVNNLAKQIMLNFFPEEGSDSNNGLTEIHQELKALSGRLTELLTTFRSSDEGHSELDEEFQHVLSLILKKLNGSEPVSTFEFIESGIVKVFLTYLSHGTHIRQDLHDDITLSYLHKVGKRFQIFAKLSMHLLDNQSGDLPVLTLVRKLQTALSTLENFPVILGQPFKLRSSIALIPDGRVTMYPTFKVHFLKGQGEQNLSDYSSDYVTVDPFTPLKSIEEHLWSKVSTRNKESIGSSTQADAEIEFPLAREGVVEGNVIDHMETDCRTSAALPMMQDMDAYSEDLVSKDDQSHLPLSVQAQCFKSSSNREGLSNLSLYLGDRKLDLGLTLYQSVIQQQMMPDYVPVNSTKFWTSVYTVTYRRALNCGESSQNLYYRTGEQLYAQNSEPSWLYAPIISKMFDSKIASDLDQLGPARDVLYLLSSLECMNRNVPKLLFQERVYAYVDERINEPNSLLLLGNSVPQKEFVSSRLTEKLEQQMQDPVAVTVGGLPSWWSQLVVSCPFLFAFDARCKYFCLSAIDPPKDLSHINSLSNSRSSIDRRISSSGLPRKKFLVIRDRILESATKMMAQLAYHKGTLEVEFGDEVGTGLGPTLEFYTLVSHALQRRGMGMWREDSLMQHSEEEIGGFLASRFGLFPRPWHCSETGSDGTLLNEVIKRFVLLGQIVAKALQDGRVLDLHLSKPFYKIILGQTLDLYDIQLFDPELGRALLKFKAMSQYNLVQAKMSTESSTSETVPGFHTTEIENLSLDFTLPGYPDYLLHSGKNNEMVTMDNLEEYVLLIEDATLNSGIRRQVEAFKAGFNQIFPIERTHIFNEEELERLLCGEQYLLAHPDELLDHVKFDHGYTASSPPILNLLEVLQGLDHNEQRAFVQFVTGTPRLPPGGLASLNPRLTIVRKHSDNFVDAELPSAMTCANYLKLPPYSSKAIMKEKLLYAISEGQGSFHLS